MSKHRGEPRGLDRNSTYVGSGLILLAILIAMLITLTAGR